MEEPWTILELAELAAETLAAAQPTGPPAGAEPSAEAGTPSGPAPSGPAASGPAASGPAASGPAAWGAAASGEVLSGAARSGSGRANGRVRDVPNERLVRWYVTVGLVDPPLSRRGRVAQYGRRHLLQLVAVKRRQAEGRSLAEIQAELAGATDEALAAVARIPDIQPAAEAPAAPGRFWTRQPGQAEPAAAGRPGQPRAAAERPEALGAAGERPGEPTAAAKQRGPLAAAGGEGRGALGSAAGHGEYAGRGAVVPAGGIVRGVRLAPGVTLLLEGADHEPSPEDVAEIISAARPLLEELASRRLRADHLE